MLNDLTLFSLSNSLIQVENLWKHRELLDYAILALYVSKSCCISSLSGFMFDFAVGIYGKMTYKPN